VDSMAQPLLHRLGRPETCSGDQGRGPVGQGGGRKRSESRYRDTERNGEGEVVCSLAALNSVEGFRDM